MPTLDEWEQALATPRYVTVESSPALVQQIRDAHAWMDADRTRRGKVIPLRKDNLVEVPTFSPTRTIEVIPAALLLRLGVVTTPVIPNLAELSATWAQIRYIWAFEIPPLGQINPKLRLSNEAVGIDFHQKAVLSDEIGVGMAAILLGTYFDAPEAVDVSIAMKDPNWRIGRQNNSSPDYIFFGPNQTNLHVVECKGTQSSRSVSIDQLRRGTEQVKSLRFANRPSPPSLVVATCLSRRDTKVLLIDPPDEGDPASRREPERLSDREWMIFDSEEFARSTRLLSQAKSLAFAGALREASDKVEQTRVPVPKRRRTTPPQTEIVENEFGRFRGALQPVGLMDRMDISIFQGIDESMYGAMVQDDVPQIAEQTLAFRQRITGHAGATAGQPVSSRRDHGILIVRTMARDGSFLEVRVSPR